MHVLANQHIKIYASKKTESQVDMKEAKRMTLFIIMINVSRNGINAIMKNDHYIFICVYYFLNCCIVNSYFNCNVDALFATDHHFE